MQLVYVKSEGEKQALGFDVHSPSCQEALESVVPLQDPKYTLGLNGTVHSKQDSFLACNIRKALSPVVIKGFRHLNSLRVLSTVTLPQIDAVLTTHSLLDLACTFNSGRTYPLLVLAVCDDSARLTAVGIQCW